MLYSPTHPWYDVDERQGLVKATVVLDCAVLYLLFCRRTAVAEVRLAAVGRRETVAVTTHDRRRAVAVRALVDYVGRGTATAGTEEGRGDGMAAVDGSTAA